MSQKRRGLLQQALSSFQSVDRDALLDVLDAHDCHHLATEDNITVLISQLGHKTLIQTPMFVIKCWRPILKTLADTLCPRRLAEVIDMHNPTPSQTSQRPPDIPNTNDGRPKLSSKKFEKVCRGMR
jgi:hypothetical protein